MMEDNNLEDLLSDDSFLRFVRKKASVAEQKHWRNWLDENSSHQILHDQAVQLIRFTSTSNSRRNVPDPIIEINKLEKLIKPGETQKSRDTKKTLVDSKHGKKNYWWVAAAVAMIIFTMYSVFENFEVIDDEVTEIVTVQSSSEFLTNYGEKATLQLSDGSSIILNANSHLKYNFTSSASTLDIDIYLQGEAWFEIKPVNADGKFDRKIRIHTLDEVIEVLGTTLNVQTSNNGTRTVLEKGIIKIESYQENGTADSNSILIEPSQLAWYMSGLEKIEITEVDPDIYTSWIWDIWVFDQTLLADVAARIEYVFGVKVIFPFENIQEKTISGSISSENLQLIMVGISKAVDISVAHLNHKIIIGG